MKLIRHLVLILIGVIFIFSGVIKLFPIEFFELQLIRSNITDWSASPYVARILIALEILLGAFLAFNLFPKLTLLSSIIMLLGYSIYLFPMMVKGSDENCGCFGSVIEMTPLQAFLKNLVLLVPLLWFYFKKYLGFFRKKVQWLIGAPLALFCVSIPFWSNPLPEWYIDKNEIITGDLDAGNLPKQFNGREINFQQGNKLVAYLSLTCRHCKNAAKKLAILDQQISSPSIYYLFIGDSSLTEGFLSETNSNNIPCARPELRDAVKITNGTFPTLFYLKNGIVERKWTGNDFGYQEISWLKEQLEI